MRIRTPYGLATTRARRTTGHDERMARLFVAVWPSPAVRAALHALEVRPEPGIRPVPPENWHITLRFLGDADPAAVEQRLAEARFPRAVAVLGPSVGRLGRKQYVIPVGGLDDLAAAVEATTGDLGMPPRRRFVGHLTVARTKPGTTSRAAGRAIGAELTVDEVALVRSDLTPSGAVYTTLATFPTASPQRSI